MTEKNSDNSTLVSLAAVVGGMCLGAVALVGIFSPESMSVVPWIVGALAIMGIALGYLASRNNK